MQTSLNQDALNPFYEEVAKSLFKGKGRVMHGKGYKQAHLTKVFSQTVNRAPEVMIKIMRTSGINKKGIQKSLAYIGRDGEVEIETSDGRELNSLEEIKEFNDYACDTLQISKYIEFFKKSELKKDNESNECARDENGNIVSPKKSPVGNTHNMIFSMPHGTDKNKMKEAFRDFAKENFESYMYAFAVHDDNAGENPHIHFTIYRKNMDTDKKIRLNKTDIQKMREEWALCLNQIGIDCKATPRKLRGEITKNVNKNKEIKIMRESKKFVKSIDLPKKLNSDREVEIYQDTKKMYTSIAENLLKGNDDEKILGKNVNNFVYNQFIAKTTNEVRSLKRELWKSQKEEAERQKKTFDFETYISKSLDFRKRHAIERTSARLEGKLNALRKGYNKDNLLLAKQKEQQKQNKNISIEKG